MTTTVHIRYRSATQPFILSGSINDSSELESDVCYRWHHLVKGMEETTTGLAESNGSLRPGGWLKVTCRLTACTLGSAPGPTLGNEYERTLPVLFNVTAIHNFFKNHIL